LVSYIYSWGENHIFILEMFIIEFVSSSIQMLLTFNLKVV